MKLTFDRLPIDHKPDSTEYKYRVLNMGLLNTKHIEQLLYVISHKGYAYKDCATCGTKQADFISQELLTLDFDSGTTVDEVLKQCEEYNLLPMLIYYTFSHTEEHPRFRMIFHLDEVIEDFRLAKTLRLAINELFPDADQIKNVTQIYQGSTKGEYGYNLSHFISPHDVILKACQKIKDGSTNGNFSRNLKRRLYLKKIPSKLVQKHGNSYNNIIGQNGKLDELYTYDFCPVNVIEEEPILNNENYDWDFLNDNCELWRKSNTGEHWITEPELFFFASSLKGKKGSIKRLRQLIDKAIELHPHSYNNAQIRNLENAIKSAKPFFRRCDMLPCPYKSNCKFNTLSQCQPLKRGYVQQVRFNETISLEEGEKQLKQAIETAFTNNSSFTIIKAQTGLGKTTAILDYLKENKKLSVCLAVPTHKLKDELFQKIEQYNLDFEVIPELDISKLEPQEQEQYNKYLIVGNYIECKHILNNSKNPEIMEYVRLTDNFNRGWLDRVIITHKRAFLKSRITNDVLVIDEDILSKSIETVDVDVNDLISLKNLANDSALDDWLNCISDKKGLIQLHPLNRKQVKNIMDKIDDNINFNVYMVLKSRLCYVEDSRVTFVIKHSLPKCKKIIILSATIDDVISRWMVKPMKVDFIEIPRIEQRGQLHQYIDLPSSRHALQEGDLIQNYKRIQNILPKDNMPIITFKKFENQLLKNGFNVVATFGSTEGLNFLEGQDIAVIGTYRTQEIQYLLFAKMLDDTVETRDLETENQVVEYNGFRFHLYTFKHPVVRQVQLYMINSELEQCVGRARILRNNNKVHLVAKLPLEDAIIENIM
ncbi:hypothetical protein SAMN05443428_11159 [Caloramator quimbayensis]|uniref:Uncharacterized protein n=1 Tax=Caloramator quimbayensis TaxID=1147123 RepID=A0A1T4XQP5_9CLOT|nr:DEAD/DEAH box helicase family protein [Caloramator quimbayensis]SKA91441.1 hypothetical protein SAMN05443428_11159 [Caloramator quimbayensis]